MLALSLAALLALRTSLPAASAAAGQRADAAERPAASAPAAAGDGQRAAGGASSAPAGQAWFEDVSERWGLAFRHVDGATPEKQLPETMGGGGAVLDADGDGRLDLYLVQSGPLPVGAGRAREAAPAAQLLLNQGARAPALWRDASASSGAAAFRGYGQGAAAGDVDGDGDQDLFVTALGPDELLLNDGAASFRAAAAQSGLDDPRWNSGAVLFDADNDGDLDLYVCCYLAIDLEHPPECGRKEAGYRAYCHPDKYAREQDRFWRNRGDAHFEERTREAGFAGHPGKALDALASDLDLDGDLDLYVAHDSVENKLWRNSGAGSFEDATLRSGAGVDGTGKTEAGMGLASGDLDGDLDFDLLVTNLDDESLTAYRNDGRLLFTDSSVSFGLEASTRPFVGFGQVLEDFDLDGDLDLAVANGHIIDNIALYNDTRTHAQPAQLFENLGHGRMRWNRVAAGPLSARSYVGRALLSGDFDGDGRPDLVMLQCGAEAHAFRNTAGGRGLLVRGLPRGSRFVAITSAGTRLLRECGAAPSYYGQCAQQSWIGLPGEARVRALELFPLGGAAQTLELDPPRGAGELVLERADGRWTAAPER